MSEESALVRMDEREDPANFENLRKYHNGNRPLHALASLCNNPEHKNPGDVPAPDIRMVFHAGVRLFRSIVSGTRLIRYLRTMIRPAGTRAGEVRRLAGLVMAGEIGEVADPAPAQRILFLITGGE